MSLLLFILAVLLLVVFLPPAIIIFIFDWIRWGQIIKRTDRTFFLGAYVIDVLGNVLYAPMLNAFFCKRGAYLFGRFAQTISLVLGVNWVNGKLTNIGEGCVGFLDWIDSDHCWKYSAEYRSEYTPKPPPVKTWKTLLFLLLFLAHVAISVPILYYTGKLLLIILQAIY